ncbi:MAG: hypothetical protein AAFU71_04160 [Cyanobacteria bacterium J06632_22]
MAISIIDQVVEHLNNMPQALQRQVLHFAQTVSARAVSPVSRRGTSGKTLLRFVGAIPQEDLALMQEAIVQDCGQVDIDEW